MAEAKKILVFSILLTFLSISLSYGKDVYSLERLLKSIEMPLVPLSAPIDNTKVFSYISYTGTSIELHLGNEGRINVFKWNVSGVVSPSPSIHAELTFSPVTPKYNKIYSPYVKLLEKRWAVIGYYYAAWKNRLEKERIRLKISEDALKGIVENTEYEKLHMEEELLDVDYLKIVDEIGSITSIPSLILSFPLPSITPISTDIGRYVREYISHLDTLTYIPKNVPEWGIKLSGDYEVNKDFIGSIGGYMNFPIQGENEDSSWKAWRQKHTNEIIIKFKSLLMRYSILTRYIAILNGEIDAKMKEFSKRYSEYLSGKKVDEKGINSLELEIEKLKVEKKMYEINVMEIASTLNAVFL